MLIVRARVASYLLAGAMIAYAAESASERAPAASQPPSPSDAKPGTHNDKNANKPQAGGDPKTTASPAAPAISITQHAPSQHYASSEDHKSSAEWWLVGLTAVLAGVTTWLVLETRRLVTEAKSTSERQAREVDDALRIAAQSAKAANQSVETMERNAVRQLRAYLNVFEVDAEWKMDDGLKQHRIWISVKFTNKGQTPAKNVKSWLGYTSDKAEPTKFLDATKEVKSFTVCGPGQSNWMHTELDVVIGEDRVQRWRDGAEMLYVWGRIDYLDAFEQARWTKFRYLMPVAGIGEKTGRFIACNDGNDYT